MSRNTTKSRFAVNRCYKFTVSREISTSKKDILPFFSSSNEKDIFGWQIVTLLWNGDFIKKLIHCKISNVPEGGLKCHPKFREILRKHGHVEKLAINSQSLF